MLETLVALDLAQRHMKEQFEMDRPVAAKARRTDREHRPRLRDAPALAMRVFARTQPHRTEAPRPTCPQSSDR